MRDATHLSRVIELAIVALAALAVLGAAGAEAQSQYLGSEACGECHPNIYNEFRVSGHPYKLRTRADADRLPLPLPQGLTWDDISYLIGGHEWKARYMDLDGYIITSVDTDGDGIPETDGMNQYNMLTGNWVDYHPGELKPYDCGSCHTTGYSPDGNQGGLPGIVGTWEFEGIECEACHGAGGHNEPIDRSAEFCGTCHVRGDPLTIPASGGFIRHHEQYNEHLASPHYRLDCVSCHNPHKKSEFSITTACEDCHSEIAAAYAQTPMGDAGVRCEDCHMARASKSAEALGPFEGDIRTHLFTINVDQTAEMFTEDGAFVQLSTIGRGAITLDFACMQCHGDDHVNWLAATAKNFHQRSVE